MRTPKDWAFQPPTGRVIIGVDEVGLGPIAGPIAACAVVLKPGTDRMGFAHVDDSKKLNEQTRETLARTLQDRTHWSVAWVEVPEYERLGHDAAHQQALRRATEETIRRAVHLSGRDPRNLLVVVDGNRHIDGGVRYDTTPIEQLALVKADSRCLEVAMASILAKHLRDRRMIELDAIWPWFGFARHKGYGTEAHVAALREHGPCPEHRPRPTHNVLAKKGVTP